MNVLVTGGAGFVGSHLTERLLAEGHAVVCLDNFDDFYDPRAKRENLSAFRGDARFELVEGDVRSEADLDDAFRRRSTDLVVHLAARAGVRESVDRADLYYDINVGGTLSLLEGMKRHGVSRLLFASSSSVYGGDGVPPFREDERADQPRSPYAASKRAGELLCRAFHHTHGIEVVCLRLFSLFGPRQRPGMAIRRFIEKILEGEPIILYGDGNSERDYTPVQDAIDGILSAAVQVSGFETVNIGSGKSVPLNELVRLIELTTGKTAVLRRGEANNAEMPVTRADIGKARRLYKYQPSRDFRAELKTMVDWLLTTGTRHTLRAIREGTNRE